MLEYYLLDPWKQILMELLSKYNNSRKWFENVVCEMSTILFQNMTLRTVRPLQVLKPFYKSIFSEET